MALVDETHTTSDPEDTKRLGEIIAQVKSRLQVNLSSSGKCGSAAMRALSYQSRYAFYQDATLGIAYYKLIQKLDEQMKTDPEQIVDKPESTGCKSVCTKQTSGSVLPERKLHTKKHSRFLAQYFEKLPEGTNAGHMATIQLSKKNEGIEPDASHIQYVARGGNFKKSWIYVQWYIKDFKDDPRLLSICGLIFE